MLSEPLLAVARLARAFDELAIRIGVLKVQADSLDRDYLDRWARLLHVSDLLDRARRQQPA
jgi:hypothetical protein